MESGPGEIGDRRQSRYSEPVAKRILGPRITRMPDNTSGVARPPSQRAPAYDLHALRRRIPLLVDR